MKKRFVLLSFKRDGIVQVFPTVRNIYKKYDTDTLGISINALWNALSKHKGVYENAKVKIRYGQTKSTKLE